METSDAELGSGVGSGKRPRRRHAATSAAAGSATLRADAIGGLSGAVAALGILLPLGLLAFAALGADGAGHGVRAAFAAAIVGELAAMAVGGVPIPGTLPRTSTTLIFAAFVAGLAADPALQSAPGGTMSILALAALCVALAGTIQILFGLLKLGSAAKFVPLPVVGGFMNGVAILIVLAQIPPLAGIDTARWMAAPMETLRHVQPWTLAVGVATVAAGLWMGRRWPKLPVLLIALVAGSVVHAVLRAVFPDAQLGRLLGAFPGTLPPPTALLPLASTELTAPLRAHLPQLVATSFVLALIGSLDALLAGVATDTAFRTRHNPNRLLIGQGAANLASSVFGGLPATYSFAVPAATYRSGGRSARAGIVGVAVLSGVLVLGHAALAYLPLTVSAAIMLVVATGLFDRWSRGLARQLKAGSRDADVVWSLAVVAAVGVITVLFGFVVSVAAGIVLSMVLLIVSMNRSLVRSVATGATRASRRVYFAEQRELLREHGDRLKMLSLEGAIFFGNAETLRRQVESIAPGARFVILDLRRVTTVDASGAVMLERLSEQLADAGVKLMLAGIVAGDRRAKALRAFGTFMRDVRDEWFIDADHALEHAERHLLDAEGVMPPTVELPVDRMSLLQDLTPEQKEALARRLERRELAAGEVLFEEGAAGDRMYLLARGSISIVTGLAADSGPVRRLVSFAPGVIFGETAMLDGGGRTARAVADEPSVVHVLTRESLDAIRRDDPALASQILFNLARHLSSLLRFANATLRADD